MIYGVKLLIGAEEKIKALNLLSSNSIKYHKVEIINNGDIAIHISKMSSKRALEILNINKIQYTIEKNASIFSLVLSQKYRIGVIVGILLLFVSTYISSKFVWNIKIEGNENLTENEVVELLANSGFELGLFIPSINYDALQNEILLNNSKISWVSLNINGNVATVKIKETKKQDNDGKDTYKNVVASDDGQIVEIKVINGVKQVEKNKVVKKGELLISGVYDSQSQGVRYTNASGEVYAIVSSNYDIVIDLQTNKKIYTGKVKTKNKIKIFSKVLNFSINNNKYNEFCDKIVKRKQIKVFDKFILPVEIIQEKYYEYEILEISHTKQEAVDLAFVELKRKLDIDLKDAELISKSIKTYYTDNAVCLNCEIYYIKDIAKEVEIFIED